MIVEPRPESARIELKRAGLEETRHGSSAPSRSTGSAGRSQRSCERPVVQAALRAGGAGVRGVARQSGVLRLSSGELMPPNPQGLYEAGQGGRDSTGMPLILEAAAA